MTGAARRGRLYRKYALYLVGAVCVALLASGSTDIYFTAHELRTQLAALQRDNAIAAAQKIEEFVAQIEQQVGWITGLPPEESSQALRLEAQRLLRQAPAISDVRLIDAAGKEQLFVSRFELDRIGSNRDLSMDDGFRAAEAGDRYFGPVYFRRQTEPYMTIALPRSWHGNGAVMVDVNLKAVWNVIEPIKVGRFGYAYVVDRNGILIAHPNISLVLRHISVAALPQVAAALAVLHHTGTATGGNATIGITRTGARVLSTYVQLPPLGWTVFIEEPLAEADAPIYAAVVRTIVLLLGGLVLAFAVSLMLARRMVSPIAALRRGAEHLASGDLDYRVDVRSGDELEAVAHRFNSMAARLQESYADLERKVAERTHELQIANEAKTRFLAAASHDLRQPMHALGLFISSLRSKADPDEIAATIDQADVAIESMAELLDGLLDLSKLDAGVVQPALQDFPVNLVLDRIAFDLGPEARDKGLDFRVVRSSAAVRGDPTMLARILLNLASNAIRFTARGKVLVGCRRHKDHVRIEVRDTGIGIPQDQQSAIFKEFYKIADAKQIESHGLGLGLSIVKRLANLLDYGITVSSVVGKGSTFAITVPMGTREAFQSSRQATIADVAAKLHGCSILLIDDDVLVLNAMRGLLVGWGCNVVTAQSGDEAVSRLSEFRTHPEIVICDYTLRNGETGIGVLARLTAQSSHPMPAILMTGDTGPDVLRLAIAAGYVTLHKPVRPAKLRSVVSGLLANAKTTLANVQAAGLH